MRRKTCKSCVYKYECARREATCCQSYAPEKLGSEYHETDDMIEHGRKEYYDEWITYIKEFCGE